MLTKEERDKKNYLYRQPKVQYDKILEIYEKSLYNQACIFRDRTYSLNNYEKRKCFELMDEIDRVIYYNESMAKKKASIDKICMLLNLDPKEYHEKILFI